MSQKEKLKEMYELQEQITDYLINTSFSKEDREALEDLWNEIDSAKDEITKKLNPLYD